MKKEPYRDHVKKVVASIQPFDELESFHQKHVLDWIESGAPLCRTIKADIPPKHLVCYFLLVDQKKERLLLTDHKKSGLWLPPGGHVDQGEHPRDTVLREMQEELRCQLEPLLEEPLFLSMVETTGYVNKHEDVSLWYVFEADSTVAIDFDPREFHQVKWYPFDALPIGQTDPHMERFSKKLSHSLCRVV